MNQKPFYEDNLFDNPESIAAYLAEAFSISDPDIGEIALMLSTRRCRDLGDDFGAARSDCGRLKFEVELAKRLAEITDAKVALPDKCISAFDQAAWDTWEATQE